jgi:hypothetical protein
MTPEVGSTMRLIMRSSVVLPLPEDPTSTVVLRLGITALKSSTAIVPSGNCFDTERNSIMMCGSFLAPGTRIDTCR